MRKILLLAAGLLGTFGSSFASPVSQSKAKTTAIAFLHQQKSKTLSATRDLDLAKTLSDAGVNDEVIPRIFIFNAGENGFVLVSADDVVMPILGYSDQSNYAANTDNKNLQKWMEGYKSQIRFAVETQMLATPDIIQAWKMQGAAKQADAVSPLMTTTWNQPAPYNALCPGGSVTGCVATAMCQIMKFWNYPAQGSGFHSYNHQTYGTVSANFAQSTYQWSSMPNNVTGANPAVAKLMFDVGVSVDMDYSPQVSGAYVISIGSPVTNCSEYALKTYFGYKPTMQGIKRETTTESQWIANLKSDLDAGRPVLYAGFGSGGGHCFVTDGYDNSNFFHFNWGWGGQEDGYFTVNALNPGSLGTGGGTGGYNSGQQIIKGLEPATGGGGGGGGGTTPPANIALNSSVSMSNQTVYYGNAFSISANFVNNATTTFAGDFGAAVFDDQNNFVDFVEILTGASLQAGYTYTNPVNFSTTGNFAFLPGNYTAGMFFKPSGGNWTSAADAGGFSNGTAFTVINPNDIELNAALTVAGGTTITQGQGISVNTNIVNDGQSTFNGIYSLDLYTLTGDFVQSVSTYNESQGLPSGYTYISPFLTFAAPSLTAAPGTYLLAMTHNPSNSGFQLTGGSYFQNPTKIKIVSPPLAGDVFEVNNAVGQASNLPLTFSGTSAVVKTTGSNIHVTSDNDFYKIVLPAGYNYTISPRLHDSYNSGNGTTYTVDGLFSHSTDGTNWSSVFDDVMPGTVVVNGGNTFYIHVAPYFAGETGTYLMEVNISRAAGNSIASAEIANSLEVFPNPASTVLNINLEHFSSHCNGMNLQNVQGHKVWRATGDLSKNVAVPLQNLAAGIYFLRVDTEDGIINRKVTVAK